MAKTIMYMYEVPKKQKEEKITPISVPFPLYFKYRSANKFHFSLDWM